MTNQEVISLSPNLMLEGIEENNWNEEQLITVLCHFRFYGESCCAYLLVANLDSEWAKFACVESPGSIHESFNEQLEDNWREIVAAVKLFHKEWEVQDA